MQPTPITQPDTARTCSVTAGTLVRTLDPEERARGIAEAPFWRPGNLATRIQSGRRSPDDSRIQFCPMVSYR